MFKSENRKKKPIVFSPNFEPTVISGYRSYRGRYSKLRPRGG